MPDISTIGTEDKMIMNSRFLLIFNIIKMKFANRLKRQIEVVRVSPGPTETVFAFLWLFARVG